jgi:alkylresorcinol/alkylpyrone synthase
MARTQARLLSLATAVPEHVLRQPEVQIRASALFGDHPTVQRLAPVFDNAGIDTRYSAAPIEWYGKPHGWTDRSQLFVESALELLERVTLACLERAGLGVADVDAIVVASTTGIATPSLDALLMERLPFRRETRRLPIFGLGCAGGVLGLSRAAAMALAEPGSRVLFLVVELCALAFRKDDLSKSNVVATALFGDGAAGALLSAGPAEDGLVFEGTGEYTFPDSLDVMGWAVEEDGLRAIFSRDIPALVRSEFRRVALAFLARHGRTLDDIAGFVCHPGGAKVLSALEEVFALPEGALAESRSVLRDFGNMSAVTVLFVLERVLRSPARGPLLLTAMGPGFSAGFVLLHRS